jgi:uncharacterized membrane protein YeaQ/YmgE (transglycosylase-associated protein family)
MGIISWVALGLITGLIASKIANKTGSGVATDVALGVVGAIVSGFLASFRVTGDSISTIIIAAIGAVVVLLLHDGVEASLRKVDISFIQFVTNLTRGALGRANPGGPSDVLDPRSDIDVVAHQTAVGLFDHIAQMNADPKFDATVLRRARVALDHRILYLHRAGHCEDHAAAPRRPPDEVGALRRSAAC